MFCPKCGSKNEEGTNFCTSCGEKLDKTKKTNSTTQNENSTSDSGGVRKALKQNAKNHVNGSFIGATAIYLAIVFIIGAIFGNDAQVSSDNINALSIVSEIIILLVGVVFGYGMLATSFKSLRGKEIKFTDVFTLPFENTKQLGYVILLMLICGAIGFVAGFLMIIPLLELLALVALWVAVIYFAPTITVFEMILADTENLLDLSFTDTFKKALDITKGKRVEYYGTMFSFIGWFLLLIPTLGILAIWLIPYMELTLVNLYRKWIGEEPFETNITGLSNGAVVGISLGGCGCFFIIIAVLFASFFAAIAVAIGSGDFDFNDVMNKIEENGFNESTTSQIDDYFNDMNIYLK